jgi:hypothetical protein
LPFGHEVKHWSAVRADVILSFSSVVDEISSDDELVRRLVVRRLPEPGRVENLAEPVPRLAAYRGVTELGGLI